MPAAGSPPSWPKMMAVLTALLLLLLPRTCHAVVLRPAAPPRGWNSFEGPGCDGCGHDNATNILQLADLFTGLLKGPDSGWKYIEMDGGWQTNNNNFSDYLFDKNGRMVPDPVRFPGGLAPLAAKLKAKGLVLGGWYIRGVEKTQLSKPVLGAEHYTLGDLVTSAALHGHNNGSCPWSPNWLGVNMSHPAAEIYYDGVAALLVDTYGLGMIKMDCSWGSGWLHADEVAAMSRSLDKAKGEVVFSLSPGGGCSVQEAKWASSGDDGAACADKNGKWMDGPGPGAASAGASMYRITTDFHGGRVLGQLQAALPFLNASLAGLNNSYMDLDMLPTLNRDGDAWIQGEKSTLLSIWSLVRSPILLAGNLEAALADAPTLASLVNPVAASVHATGQNVRVVTATKDLCVLASEFTLPPAVALTTGATAATAVTVTNLAANDTAPGPVSFQSLGLASGGTVRDVWTGQAVPSDTTGWIVDAMWSSGTRFYYVTHSASSSSTASTASSTGAPAAPLTIIKSDDEAEAAPVMFHVLQPADFAHLLQEDLPWVREQPLFAQYYTTKPRRFAKTGSGQT
jgi:alpha-galactosidase